jgi:soluble lytic murein transglycosylase-like protein
METEAPLIHEPNRKRSGFRRRSLPILAALFACLVIGPPLAVFAKDRLQDLWTVRELCKYLENHRKKNRILKVLRQNDLEIKDARQIAQAVVQESNKYDIPASIFLAIMKKESNFNIYARSPINALGIMQIHPLIWDAYTKKMNLNVSRENAFEPALNIMISAALINDLRDRYTRMGYEQNVLWDYILSAYYAGGESLKEGLKKNHRHYVRKVRQYHNDISNRI